MKAFLSRLHPVRCNSVAAPFAIFSRVCCNSVAASFAILCSVCCNHVAAQPQGYTLQQLLDSALLHNRAVTAARHDVAAATHQRREAYTRYFPQVSATAAAFQSNRHLLSAEMTPADMLPTELQSLAATLPAEAVAALSSPISIGLVKHGALAGVTALQPIYAGGQITTGNRLAKIGEEASLLQLQLSEQEVVTTVCQYYWQLYTLHEKERTLTAAEALLSDLHKDVSLAVQAGLALRNDLLQVELRQGELASQKLSLNNGIDIVERLLAQYCGIEEERLFEEREARSEEREHRASPDFYADFRPESILAPRSPLPAPRKKTSPNDQTTERPNDQLLTPEYQLLTKQLEAAQLQERMERGRLLPTLAVGAGYSYSNLIGQNQFRAAVFATLNIPISDWWGGSHAVKRRQIAVMKAQEDLADNAQLLDIRARKALNDVDEATQRLDIARQSIAQADENLRLHRDFYAAGTATMSDLLEAQLLHQQAHDRFAETFALCQNSIVAYHHAIGLKIHK